MPYVYRLKERLVEGWVGVGEKHCQNDLYGHQETLLNEQEPSLLRAEQRTVEVPAVEEKIAKIDFSA